MLISIVTWLLNLCIIEYKSVIMGQRNESCSEWVILDGWLGKTKLFFLVSKEKLLRVCLNMLSFWIFWDPANFFFGWKSLTDRQKCLTDRHIDLERTAVLTPRLITSHIRVKPVLTKKLLQLVDFALQQHWFFHVIQMEISKGYNFT